MIAFILSERANARLMPVVYRAPQRSPQLPRTAIAAFANPKIDDSRRISPTVSKLGSSLLQIPLDLFGGPVCIRFDHTYSGTIRLINQSV